MEDFLVPLAEHANPLVERFSTQGIRAEKRLQYWNDLNNETFTGLAIDAKKDRPYSAQLERLRIGSIKLIKVGSKASDIVHTREHISRSAGNQHFLVHLQMEGESVSWQAGRSAKLAPGDLSICETTRPYSLSFTKDVSFLVLKLPLAEMKLRLPHLEDVVSVRVSNELGRTRLLKSFIDAVWTENLLSSSPDRTDDLEPIIMNLIAACLIPACNNSVGQPFSRTEREVFALAERNATLPDYGVQDIAAASGLSPRIVQKIFASKGTTASSYLLSKRLTSAARALETSDEKITFIATDAGFNDHAYFTRAFRAAFGMNPKEYRMRVRQIGGCFTDAR